MLSYLSVLALLGTAGWLFMGAFDTSDETSDHGRDGYDPDDPDAPEHGGDLLSMESVQQDIVDFIETHGEIDDAVVSLQLQDDETENENWPQTETANGFRMSLPPDAQLDLNIEDDVAGQVLQVAAKFDAASGAEDGRTDTVFSLNFYLAPGDLPENGDDFRGTEADLIERYGLEKLGELAMGRFTTEPADDGDGLIMTEYSRQTEEPEILCNRPITSIEATFI